MLKHRLIFGAILIAFLLGLIYSDKWISNTTRSNGVPDALSQIGLYSFDGPIVAAIVVVLVILGTWELRRLFVSAGHTPLLIWPIIINIFLVLTTFLSRNGPASGEIGRRSADYQFTVFWLTIALLGTAFFVARRRKTDGAIAAIGTTLLMIFYLGVLPQYLIRIRLSDPEGGVWLLLYFVGTVKICDIGAFFTGRALGKHKMIEWLSPKKTWEGLLGGVAASVLLAVLIPVLVERFAAPGSDVRGLFPGITLACIFGVLMALVGQAGDLLESLFKRDAGSKDSANAIPAFGGVLDILDSPLLAAPIGYAMLLQ